MEASSGHYSPEEGEPSRRFTPDFLLHFFPSRNRWYIFAQIFFLVPSLIILQSSPEFIICQGVNIVILFCSILLLWMMYRQNQVFFRVESIRVVSLFLSTTYLLKHYSNHFEIVPRTGILFLSSMAFFSLVWLVILKSRANSSQLK